MKNYVEKNYVEFVKRREEIREKLRAAGKSDRIPDNEVCLKAGRHGNAMRDLKNKSNQTENVRTDLFEALEAIFEERLAGDV
jgi:hypothetical protein